MKKSLCVLMLTALLVLYLSPALAAGAYKAPALADWTSPATTYVTAGRMEMEKGYLLNKKQLNTVLCVKESIGGWTGLQAPAAGDYSFTVDGSSLSGNRLIIHVFREGQGETDLLIYPGTEGLNTQVIHGVAEGEKLYWREDFLSTGSHTALTDSMLLMVTPGDWSSGCVGHEWKEAPCKSPAECTLCKLVTDAPVEHDWQPATNLDPKTCKVCGEQEGEALMPWLAGIVRSKPWKVVTESFSKILLPGLTMTIPLTAASFSLGLIIALITALVQVAKVPVLRRIARLYIWVFRGTPLLVQLYIVFYGLGKLGLKLEAFPAALIVFSLNTGAYDSETIRATIESVDPGQLEAGYCVGMNYLQIMARIILPQAMRTAFPPLSNSLIALVKDTSLASNITVLEMFLATQRIASRNFEYFLLYCEVAVVYLMFCTVLTWLQHVCEKKLEPKR